jgi:hypothetical protein
MKYYLLYCSEHIYLIILCTYVSFGSNCMSEESCIFISLIWLSIYYIGQIIFSTFIGIIAFNDLRSDKSYGIIDCSNWKQSFVPSDICFSIYELQFITCLSNVSIWSVKDYWSMNESTSYEIIAIISESVLIWESGSRTNNANIFPWFIANYIWFL